MVEAILGMVLVWVALAFYMWTRGFDERVARLEKRDFLRTEVERRRGLTIAEQNVKDAKRVGGSVMTREEDMERLRRAGEGVE